MSQGHLNVLLSFLKERRKKDWPVLLYTSIEKKKMLKNCCQPYAPDGDGVGVIMGVIRTDTLCIRSAGVSNGSTLTLSATGTAV